MFLTYVSSLCPYQTNWPMDVLWYCIMYLRSGILRRETLVWAEFTVYNFFETSSIQYNEVYYYSTISKMAAS